MARICPLAFLSLLRRRMFHQKRVLATTRLGAKMRIEYTLGFGSSLVGLRRALTKYWRIFIWSVQSRGS